MKRKLGPVCLLTLLLAGAGRLPAAAEAAPPAGAALTVVEQAAGSLTLELSVPEPAVHPDSVNGRACYRLDAPGLTPSVRPGVPPLPARGVLLSVPAQGLNLEVLDAPSRPLAAYPLCPAPRTICRDGSTSLPCETATGPDLTGSDLTGLERPVRSVEAEIGFTGMLRGVPVAQVQLFPIRVVGDQVLFSPRLRVRLTWQASPVVPAEGLPPRTRGAGTHASPPLKLSVERDGIVQLTYTDLVDAGWDPAALDPLTLRLSLLGAELPIWVEGEGDGRFDPGDALVFYGQAADSPYTRANVYWLTAGGAPGVRMGTRDVSPVHGYPVPATFTETLRAEGFSNPSGYWQNPPGREAQDHWYWTAPLNAPASAGLPFHAPALDAGVPASLRVQLAGRTDDPLNPDHHTRIRLNGTLLDDRLWNGQIEFRHAVTGVLPLLEGDNAVAVETVGDTGAAVDSLYANWLELDYAARYVAQDDQLAFGAPSAGGLQFRVTCFNQAGVEAFDVTDSAAPVRLEGVQTVPESACYTAILEDTAGAGSRYLALARAQRQPPSAVIADQASDLCSPAAAADEIIITSDGFYDAVQPLADHRRAQGLRVQVARLTDVYDEFGGGLVTPYALRDFLACAYQAWTPRPTYALLVGDAHLDWLDRFATGQPIYLPTYIFDASSVGETANDNWFACVDGADPLPDLFLGRLPARSSAEVQAQVDKIVAYEATPPAGDWARRALYVADDDQPIFESAADAWIGQLPPAYHPQRVYASAYPPGDPQDDIVGAVNTGDLLVTYVGHGNQDRWGTWGGGGRIFDNAAVARLANAGRLPVMLTATCLNGFFVNPLPGYEYCLAEELARKPDRGAAGVWSPTALGSPVEHQILFAALFDVLFARTGRTSGVAMLAAAPPEVLTAQPPDVLTLGSVTTQAKWTAYAQGVSRELVETFALFGDPALRVSPPPGYSLSLPLVLKNRPGP